MYKIEEIINSLRDANVGEAYSQISEMLTGIVDLVERENKNLSEQYLNGITLIIKEITLAMKRNDIVYIIDLLKYELNNYITL